jgi:hypothetical protein
LPFVRGEAAGISKDGQEEARSPVQTQRQAGFCNRRWAMSAALTLPYVWAVTGSPSRPSPLRLQPLSGAAFYRKRTEALLRRYLRVSMDMGRMPSLLSQTVFRGRASCSKLRNFEDSVVFVIDVETCLKRLDAHSQRLVARITLQEYTQAETAELTGESVRSVIRKYAEALDRLTAILLESGLLNRESSERCQEP